MFENEIETIKNSFLNYFANGRYLVIFCIALLILFVEEKKKENRNFLIYHSVLLFIITMNPICAWLLLKVIPVSVYYRMFWMIPIGIIIAYLGTEFIFKADKKAKKIIITIFFIGIIAYSGIFVYTSQTFEEVNNFYKIPNEYVEVTNIIREIPIDYKKAMISTDLVGYIRQIDASIKLAYPRRPYGDYEMYNIVRWYVLGNVENLTFLCNIQNVNIIVYDKSIQLSEPLENYKFNLYAQTEHYDIYVFEDEQK